jgi:hypothetical protein
MSPIPRLSLGKEGEENQVWELRRLKKIPK